MAAFGRAITVRQSHSPFYPATYFEIGICVKSFFKSHSASCQRH